MQFNELKSKTMLIANEKGKVTAKTSTYTSTTGDYNRSRK